MQNLFVSKNAFNVNVYRNQKRTKINDMLNEKRKNITIFIKCWSLNHVMFI